MITPKLKSPTKVVFGPCRQAYCHVITPYVPQGETQGKYMTTILIPKEETGTINAIKKAIDAAVSAGITKKWNGKTPKKLDTPLRDGDEKENAGPEFAGCYYLNAKSKLNRRPGVDAKDGQPIVSEDEFYSGVWALCSVDFFAYAANGNNGVGCSLCNLRKYKDDERFGGGASAEADFAGIDLEDDDDM